VLPVLGKATPGLAIRLSVRQLKRPAPASVGGFFWRTVGGAGMRGRDE
jgi:hypothetical protein